MAMPLIGWHDKAADERATIVYMADKVRRELAAEAEQYIRGDGAEEMPLKQWEKDLIAVPEDYDPFPNIVNSTMSEAEAVLVRKHQDYGPKNISLSPGGPLNGLRVRMWDKMARINNLIDKGVDPQNESLRDSFLDLANYSIIAMMVIDGNWPSE